jgi:hypothetical protein
VLGGGRNLRDWPVAVRHQQKVDLINLIAEAVRAVNPTLLLM